jgi:hypothetical protein
MIKIPIKLNIIQNTVLFSVFLLLYITYIIPGINITTPTHADIYTYSTNFDGNLLLFTNLYLAPRPIMFLVLKLGGALSFESMMYLFSIIGSVSYIAPLLVYSKLSLNGLQKSQLLFYFLLVVSYPAIYLGLVHDIGSRLALIFASLAVYNYILYHREQKGDYLFYMFLYSLLGFLSKETFGPTLLLLVMYLGYLANAKIRVVAMGVVTVIVALCLSILHSKIVGSPFTSGEASYAINFNIISILSRGLQYLKLSLTPIIVFSLMSIAGHLIFNRNWRDLGKLIVGFIIAWTSILPNSILSQHGGSNYEMILVPLFSTLIVIHVLPIALNKINKVLIVILLSVFGISGVIWGEYQIKKNYWWEMGVANFNQNLIQSIEIHRAEFLKSNHIVILGLQQDHIVNPWTPFTYSKFLEDNFGFRTTIFTIVLPDKVDAPVNISDERRRYVSNFESINKGNVDLIAVFDGNGFLWRIIRNKDDILKILDSKRLDPVKIYNPKYWKDSVDTELFGKYR